MKDDDGVIYYEGYRIGEGDPSGSEAGFEPLDDYGCPNAGCTSIWYWEKNRHGVFAWCQL